MEYALSLPFSTWQLGTIHILHNYVRGEGGQGSFDGNNHALKGDEGWRWVSTKMVMYYMLHSVKLIL